LLHPPTWLLAQFLIEIDGYLRSWHAVTQNHQASSHPSARLATLGRTPAIFRSDNQPRARAARNQNLTGIVAQAAEPRCHFATTHPHRASARWFVDWHNRLDPKSVGGNLGTPRFLKPT